MQTLEKRTFEVIALTNDDKILTVLHSGLKSNKSFFPSVELEFETETEPTRVGRQICGMLFGDQVEPLISRTPEEEEYGIFGMMHCFMYPDKSETLVTFVNSGSTDLAVDTTSFSYNAGSYDANTELRARWSDISTFKYSMNARALHGMYGFPFSYHLDFLETVISKTIDQADLLRRQA